MAVRYLYGENGIKQNIKKAIIKLFECRQEMPTNTCVNAILGRGFELKKNFSLAHKMYDMAYQLIEQETKPSCDCAYSYYAHSLIEGVGVKQDVEEAKSIILKAVQKFKKFICSHTAYYYAYFALQGDQKFDISKAYELLSFDYPFVRFDISRIVYLTKLEEKLRIDYIVEADQDGYQGEKIWLIPYDSFSCPEKYIWTHTYYGSCAGCDTLKGIAHYDYGYPTCEQVEEYLTLALHLLQRMKPLMTREEEEWEERMDKAVDSGQGEKMMQQLRLIASK